MTQDAPWIGKTNDEHSRKLAYICDINSCSIYDGDEYYDINGVVICEHCMKSSRQIAEAQNYDI
jgi:hypothetical protein